MGRLRTLTILLTLGAWGAATDGAPPDGSAPATDAAARRPPRCRRSITSRRAPVFLTKASTTWRRSTSTPLRRTATNSRPTSRPCSTLTCEMAKAPGRRRRLPDRGGRAGPGRPGPGPAGPGAGAGTAGAAARGAGPGPTPAPARPTRRRRRPRRRPRRRRRRPRQRVPRRSGASRARSRRRRPAPTPRRRPAGCWRRPASRSARATTTTPPPRSPRPAR